MSSNIEELKRCRNFIIDNPTYRDIGILNIDINIAILDKLDTLTSAIVGLNQHFKAATIDESNKKEFIDMFQSILNDLK